MPQRPTPPWRLWIDTGGTFTDCCAVDPEGRFHRLKILSSSSLRTRLVEVLGPRRVRCDLRLGGGTAALRGLECRRLGGSGGAATVVRAEGDVLEVDAALFESTDCERPFELRSSEEAPVLAARLLTKTPLGCEFPPLEMRLATTRGTNALLERKGAETAFVVTRGFRDLLEVGSQARPDLFALEIEKPRALHRVVLEADERLDASGAVLRPLSNLEELVAAARDSGCRSAAVALLHSYRNPEHELAVARALRDAGVGHVTTSAEVAPLIKLLARAQTAVVDAYLSPVVGAYLDSIREAILGEESDAGRHLLVMSSAGGLADAREYRAKDSLLSGPAGGVVGAAAAARAAGYDRVLTFDMGGTSTDVARYDGDFTYLFEQRVGDAVVVAPALHIETVAAGGGSICAAHEGRLKVGPESAGADPGPACYGAHGPLTLTDVNLLLGRLDAARFEIPISAAAARSRADEVLGEAGIAPADADRALEGFVRIANERMAEAIRSVSVRRGYDPREHALVTFGGAGAQHACAIARELGIDTVLVPADASLLSAVGLGQARIERFGQRQVLQVLDTLDGAVLSRLLCEARDQALAQLERDGVEGAAVRRVIARLRFAGQEAALDVEPEEVTVEALAKGFAERYETTFGYLPQRQVELESLRVVASAGTSGADWLNVKGEAVEEAGAEAAHTGRLFVDGEWRRVAVRDRVAVASDERVLGPALVTERRSCTVVESGWCARVEPRSRCLVLERAGRSRRHLCRSS